jgi:hypothetical protein
LGGVAGCCDGKIDDNGVRRLLSEDQRLSFEVILSVFSSLSLFTSLSFFRCSLTVSKPCSSQRTEADELPDEAWESVKFSETDPVERTEPDRLRFKMVTESTESRVVTGATFEEAVDPVRTVRRRIVLGKPNPRMLCFFLDPIVFGASGLAVRPPTSKLLDESCSFSLVFLRRLFLLLRFLLSLLLFLLFLSIPPFVFFFLVPFSFDVFFFSFTVAGASFSSGGGIFLS